MRRILIVAAVATPVVATASGFFNTFDDSSSSNSFQVNQIAGSTDTITFGYDYSANGIAEAPNTPTGATAQKGLFIMLNKGTTGALNGVNIFAANAGSMITFSGDYKLTFDMWMNVPSTLTNTTEQALFGINSDGVGTNTRTGSTQTGADGVWYHLANEGGYGSTSTTKNSRDYVAYQDNTVIDRKDNGEEPFKSLFPSGPLAGTPGNGWVSVKIEQVGTNVKLYLNNTLITDQTNAVATSGGAFVGYQDPFSSSVGSTDLFVVYDNIKVTAVPEPATIAALGLGALALIRRRQR